MTAQVQTLIDSFDRLTGVEQQEVAVAILRRTANMEFPPLTDEDLAMATDETFVELDAREAADGKR